jgi:hypothetical protein
VADGVASRPAKAAVSIVPAAAALHIALPAASFDRLELPRLAGYPQRSDPPETDPYVRWRGRGVAGHLLLPPIPIMGFLSTATTP